MIGQELYEFIKNDQELVGMIRQALTSDGALNVRRGRRPDQRKRASREFRRFWSGQESTSFRLKLQQKLGAESAARMMRGSQARIRTVMILIIDDVLQQLESQEVRSP